MKFLLSIILMFVSLFSFSQDKEKVSKGQLSGQWRTYYQSTINKETLKDFYALATGGKIKYVQSIGKHFSLGGAFYTSVNLGIQDLTIPDETTGRVSRYEAGLFDVEDLSNSFIAIPGELFVRYKSKKHQATLGRMKIVSPFLNPQDGRMIPTLEQGIWYQYRPDKWKLQFGVFNQIAPRSTSGFFNIGESIGKYPIGRHVDGAASQYRGNTTSDWMAVTNIDFNPSEKMKVEFWHYYVENVFQSIYIKPTLKLNAKTSILVEWLYQSRVSDGGNSVQTLRYFVDRSANIGGLQIERKVGKAKLSIGYDHILKGGRFIFPREWGREFLFSFQKRERSEGSANNHALVAYYDNTFGGKKNKWRSIISVGHHWKADVTNAADNKYALPDYTHINLDVFWIPENIKDLRPELLLTYKKSSGEFPDNPNFIFNKVDLFIINFIVNYTF